jgi:hypothetical protein
MADQLFQIKHRFSGKILSELECGSLKLCVEAAVRTDAYLRGAYLRGADLRGADLTDAYLTGAYLRGAYLRGADLTDADLTDADLTDAYLTDAYLRGADLRGADLTDADLTGAYLRGAYLTGAYLRGADGKKTTIQKTPIQISGLRWHIIIFDKDMRIGCEYHSLTDWWSYDDTRIADMDSDALDFWMQNKAMLQGVCNATGRLAGEQAQ